MSSPVKRIVVSLSIVTLLACLGLRARAGSAPSGTPKYKIHWVIGHRNLDFFEEAAKNFKKAVEQRSHGDIAIEITTTGIDDGSDIDVSPELAEIPGMVSRGEAEMGHSFVDVMGSLDPRMHVFESPFSFRSYRHLEGVFEGPLGGKLLEDLKPHHLQGLSFTYSGGANGIATTDREVRKPEDLKGLKIGVYGDAVDQAWLKALGAIPVAIGHRLDAIVPAAQAGKLDGVVITWRNLKVANRDHAFKYFSMLGSSYLVSVTYVNESFFKSLPREYQAMLMEESRQSGRVERATTIELNEQSRRELLTKNVHPVHLTEDGRARFVDALQPAYRDIDRVIGQGLRERVQETPDAAVYPSVQLTLVKR